MMGVPEAAGHVPRGPGRTPSGGLPGFDERAIVTAIVIVTGGGSGANNRDILMTGAGTALRFTLPNVRQLSRQIPPDATGCHRIPAHLDGWAERLPTSPESGKARPARVRRLLQQRRLLDLALARLVLLLGDLAGRVVLIELFHFTVLVGLVAAAAGRRAGNQHGAARGERRGREQERRRNGKRFGGAIDHYHLLN